MIKNILGLLVVMLISQPVLASNTLDFRHSLEQTRFQLLRNILLTSKAAESLDEQSSAEICKRLTVEESKACVESEMDTLDKITQVIVDLGGSETLSDEETDTLLKEINAARI